MKLQVQVLKNADLSATLSPSVDSSHTRIYFDVESTKNYGVDYCRLASRVVNTITSTVFNITK